MDDHRTLAGLVPIVEWLRSYRKEWWRPDVIAGLTAAAVVIPKAMAYATIAVLPSPEPGFDDPTALDAAVDRLDPQPTVG